MRYFKRDGLGGIVLPGRVIQKAVGKEGFSKIGHGPGVEYERVAAFLNPDPLTNDKRHGIV